MVRHPMFHSGMLVIAIGAVCASHAAATPSYYAVRDIDPTGTAYGAPPRVAIDPATGSPSVLYSRASSNVFATYTAGTWSLDTSVPIGPQWPLVFDTMSRPGVGVMGGPHGIYADYEFGSWITQSITLAAGNTAQLMNGLAVDPTTGRPAITYLKEVTGNPPEYRVAVNQSPGIWTTAIIDAPPNVTSWGSGKLAIDANGVFHAAYWLDSTNGPGDVRYANTDNALHEFIGGTIQFIETSIQDLALAINPLTQRPMIAIAKNGATTSADTLELLEFDGSQWNLSQPYICPNGHILSAGCGFDASGDAYIMASALGADGYLSTLVLGKRLLADAKRGGGNVTQSAGFTVDTVATSDHLAFDWDFGELAVAPDGTPWVALNAHYQDGSGRNSVAVTMPGGTVSREPANPLPAHPIELGLRSATVGYAGSMTFALRSQRMQRAHLALVDVAGRVVARHEDVVVSPAAATVSWRLPELASGVYYAVARGEWSGEAATKCVVVR